MLFKHRFHEGIRNGTVTRTYRAWTTPRVRVGEQYRLGPRDAVEVDAIETVQVGKIPAADARRCGVATDPRIERNPEVAASKLAPRAKRETRAFKVDVRKLKELGLTVSHEVGYSLSPRGKALLKD